MTLREGQLPEGWLSGDEADELRRLAAGKTVLELGAWKGRSTVVLSGVAKYVVSVDRHQGIAEVGGGDSLPDYLEAVRNLDNVSIVIGSFQQVVPLFRQEFDLVYVDGDHDADSTAGDITLALSAVKDDGIIALHDWDFDSVREGANKVLGNRHTAPESLVGSIASFTVHP